MYVAEIDKIKLDLIKWISSLEDEGQLNIVESMRLSWLESQKDSWDLLTDWEREQIRKGKEDFEKGRFHTSEEIWKRVEKLKQD